MVANCIRFRRAANVAVGPQRPQSYSRRPHTSTHTKHAPPKRAQPKNMVRSTPPLCCVDRSHRLCATGWSPLLGQLAGLFSESNAFAAEACTGSCERERISISRNCWRNKLPDTRLHTRSSLLQARQCRTSSLRQVTRMCIRKKVHTVAWGRAGDEDACWGDECSFFASGCLYCMTR